MRWDAKWGDSIVSSFVFREWKRAYPGIKVEVITTPNMSQLFKEYFAVDHVYEINKRPSYAELSKLARDIGEADLLVHLSKALKMKDLYFMSKVKIDNIAGLDDAVELINLKLGGITQDEHFSGKYRKLLELTGVVVQSESYIVPDNKASQDKVDQFISLIDEPILVFNPYGSGGSRKLNERKIKEVISVVNGENASVNIVLLTIPEKKHEVEKICADYSNVYYYADSQSIYDSIAIMRRADWVVSVDTATVHIATGLRKPLIAIYNPDEENYKEWHPNSSLSKSIFSQRVYPQDINGINLGDFKDYISYFISFHLEHVNK
ncbi:glycosyltransferase family 9 protein [Oceanisphaera sp.]|uniref:glycosyltransferase family 9 protein n=1 Tax=Oceanisphaera sp. TaxID=1929979 RepID=UPI003A8CFAFB